MAAWQDFLSSSPQVCGGEICATGTRIPVTVILDSLAEGASKDEILASYPSLRIDHISAALAYAAELAHGGRQNILSACLHTRPKYHPAGESRESDSVGLIRSQQCRGS